MKILIVEDESTSIAVIHSILSRFSDQIDVVSNGIDALSKVKEALLLGNPYDMVCLDLILPTIDGFAVLKGIRRYEEEILGENLIRSRVVIVSAISKSEFVTKGMSLGADAYLVKPLKRERLEAVIAGIGDRAQIRKCHVLVVDHIKKERDISTLALSADFTVETVQNLRDAFVSIANAVPDCIVTENKLPDGDMEILLRQLSYRRDMLRTPVVVLTDSGSERVAVTALKLGASDYLLKSDLTPDTLVRSVTRAIENFRLRDMVIKQEEEKDLLIAELRKSVEKVNMLSGMLPICSSCKKIRDDGGYWQQVEEFVAKYSDVRFSHGLCPDCLESLFPDMI